MSSREDLETLAIIEVLHNEGRLDSIPGYRNLHDKIDLKHGDDARNEEIFCKIMWLLKKWVSRRENRHVVQAAIKQVRNR